MISVVHFEYLPQEFENYLRDLESIFKKIPGVDYKLFPPMKGEIPQELKFFNYNSELEKLLENTDVFLAHPGLDACPTVIEEYPARFPKLKIAMLTLLPEDSPGYIERNYHLLSLDTARKIRFLNYEDLPGITDFVVSAEKNKENK